MELGGEGWSDLFALSKICQGDVISLRPTMKVISQSKGISREPWLLQRSGKLGPMTLFMCEVRQTASSRRQLKWLMIFFSPPSTSQHIIHVPWWHFYPGDLQKSKTEGSKRQDTRQILYCKRASLAPCNNTGRKTFLINMHLFRSTNGNSGYCKRSCPPLSACEWAGFLPFLRAYVWRRECT